MNRRHFLGVVPFLTTLLPRSVLAQSCGSDVQVFFALPRQENRSTISLFEGAHDAQSTVETSCDVQVNFFELDGNFSSSFDAVRRVAAGSDKAVFVGALGEGIGAKFASQYPNIVFVDLLDGDRIFNNPNRNYYYLPAKNVTEGSGAWEIDLYEQGFSAVDFSSALAQRISEKGYFDPQSAFASGSLSTIIETPNRKYELDPFRNEIFVVRE